MCHKKTVGKELSLFIVNRSVNPVCISCSALVQCISAEWKIVSRLSTSGSAV